MKTKARSRTVVGVAVIAFAGFAGAALAVDFSLDPAINDFRSVDFDNGTVEQVSTSQPRRFLFRIETASKSRAEIRRNSQNSGIQTMGGVFILNNQSGNFLSVIQALNVEQQGSQTGPSEPVAQLAVRKTGRSTTVSGERRDIYEFYIEQASNKPTCAGLGTFTKTERIPIRMEYRQGDWPTFYRTGDKSGSCRGGKSDRKMGDPSGGVQGTYFYGKLGVYKTNDGTGSASVTWDAVYD